MAPTEITVLCVDDDPNDTELFQAAMRKAGVECVLHIVEDGEQAVVYLSGKGIYADRRLYQLPSLILLDLKMPRATGIEILQWIRSHPKLHEVPVVILSGSESEADIRSAYDTGADSYLIKPLGFNALVSLVHNINVAWLTSRSPLQAQ